MSECVPADAAPSLISVVADAVPTTDLQLRARLLQRPPSRRLSSLCHLAVKAKDFIIHPYQKR